MYWLVRRKHKLNLEIMGSMDKNPGPQPGDKYISFLKSGDLTWEIETKVGYKYASLLEDSND